MFLTRTEEKALTEIRLFIESNQQHPIRIPDLIRRWRLKESKLTKGFKQMFGSSVYTYYLTCAMQYAREMLEQGASVKEVAITLGYSKTSSFSRSFLKEFGVLPTSIRMRQ